MTKINGWGIVFRTVVMSCISVLFIWASRTKVLRLRGSGQPIGSRPYVEEAIWTAALLIWLGIGWRDWKRHADSDKG
jgi:hypothetical protein